MFTKNSYRAVLARLDVRRREINDLSKSALADQHFKGFVGTYKGESLPSMLWCLVI